MEYRLIEHIEQNAVAQTASEFIAKGSVPSALVPNGYEIKSLEHLHAAPTRFRGAYKTECLHDFCSYVNTEDEPVVFVNQEKLTATAFFDLGCSSAPGHGEHRSILSLMRTAPYKELLKMNGQKLSQKQFAEWLEDWRDFITPMSDTGEVLPLKNAVAAIRNVTLAKLQSAESTVDTFSSSKSTLEQIDAKSKDTLPAGFIFKCRPCAELSEREISVRASMITTGEPAFTLRIVQTEVLDEAIAKEFVELLAKNINTETNIFIGEFFKGI